MKPKQHSEELIESLEHSGVKETLIQLGSQLVDDKLLRQVYFLRLRLSFLEEMFIRGLLPVQFYFEETMKIVEGVIDVAVGSEQSFTESNSTH